MIASPARQDGEEFTRLLVQNHKRIMGLILALVPNGPDAYDVLHTPPADNPISYQSRRIERYCMGENQETINAGSGQKRRRSDRSFP